MQATSESETGFTREHDNVWSKWSWTS